MNREMERDDSIPDAILKQLANAIFFLLLENNTKASMDHSNTHTRTHTHKQYSQYSRGIILCKNHYPVSASIVIEGTPGADNKFFFQRQIRLMGLSSMQTAPGHDRHGISYDV